MTYMVANFVVRDGLHNVGSANTFSIVAPKQEIILMIVTGFFFLQSTEYDKVHSVMSLLI